MRHWKLSALRDQAYVAGRAPGVELIRGVKTHALLIHLTADITIAGAAGGAVVAEGLQRLLTQIRLLENGTPRVDISGRVLAYLSGRDQFLPPVIGALANAGAQNNTILRAAFALRFSSLTGADPGETAYVEMNPNAPTFLEYNFSATPGAELITGAGLTLNALTVRTTQVYDPVTGRMPKYLPRIQRQAAPALAGAQSNYTIPLNPESNTRIESILLHSIVDGVTNDAVWTGPVTFRGDRERYVDGVDFRQLSEEARAQFFGLSGGGPRPGFLEVYSRPFGKLSEMYVPGQDTNPRIEAAATNPGAVTQIDVYLIGREPVPGYTEPIPADW